MIKEVLVVEGKADIARIRQAADVEMIATEGFTLRKGVIEKIRQAYEKRGIIILTDPDSAGERIRKYLTELFPQAKHAFVPRKDAIANNDLGIEQASPEAIRAALQKVRTTSFEPKERFTMADILLHDLTGTKEAAERRAAVGAALGIGYSNTKQFIYRLNHYGVTRKEWEEAILSLDENEGEHR